MSTLHDADVAEDAGLARYMQHRRVLLDLASAVRRAEAAERLDWMLGNGDEQREINATIDNYVRERRAAAGAEQQL